MKTNELRLVRLIDDLRDKPVDVLIEFSHPALQANKQWDAICITPSDQKVIIVTAVSSTIKQAYFKIVIGLMDRSAFDAREDLCLHECPPRQQFGVRVIPWEDTPPGIVLLYGWKVRQGGFEPPTSSL